MARVNIDILGISEPKWIGMGEFNSDDHYISTTGGKNPLGEMEQHSYLKKRERESEMQYLGAISKICFQDKPFNITVIQVYAPATNAKEAEVEWFYEDLQDLPELTPIKDILFITGDLDAKIGHQEILGATGKFGLGVQIEAGQRLAEFCRENTLLIANTLFQQHKRQLCDGQH